MTIKPQTTIDEVACPKCSGMGWREAKREPWPDCGYCEGTGIVTEQKFEAYYDQER